MTIKLYGHPFAAFVEKSHDNPCQELRLPLV